MNCMFCGCDTLTNLDLSNFDIQQETRINNIFHENLLLKKENIITKDNKILKIFFKFN